MTEKVLNIFGEEMEACCFDPLTGWKRDGYCNTDDFDHGSHVVCCEVTDAFLAFSKERGNDLSTPRPEFNFPGLKEGDRWCLCAMRWQEAFEAGVAPRVFLESCHQKALEFVNLEDLEQHAMHRLN
jgi:uncharacterized protein (DUF2237 family)|tara:strand:- start:176 stop:553 length:378 start_codon:yes stop_codon:yes gene_type:complete